MGLLEWMRGEASKKTGVQGDTDTVRRIVGELEKLEPARARHVAAFALYIEARLAHSDKRTVFRKD